MTPEECSHFKKQAREIHIWHSPSIQ
jgi:hypothetical protein